MQNDAFTVRHPLVEAAHVQVDRVRMATLAAGLDHFAARGLENQCFVMWTNHYGEALLHSFVNVPHIVWGSGGGYLRQGADIDAGNTGNNQLLNTLITAATQDTGIPMNDFGEGTPGPINAILT